MRYAAFLTLIVLSLLADQAAGQDTIPDIGTPTIPQIDNGGTGGGGTGGGADGTVEPIELELGGNLDDERNQGFVGSTADRVQQLGFVGAASETSGPPLSGEGTFGGGINNSGTQAGGGGGGGGNQFQAGGVNGGFGGQGQLGGGTQNGFQVIRSSLRTNLVTQFNAPPISNEQTVIRFQNRFARQPVPVSRGTQFGSGGQTNSSVASVNVQIENRTAVLTGYTGSQSQRDRWERQLRLEPGVDRIVNLIEVVPTFSSPAR